MVHVDMFELAGFRWGGPKVRVCQMHAWPA
jgi:hypothetical protein